MKLGIFAKTYQRPTVEEIFAAAAADGFASVQFNFVSAGLSPMPDVIEPRIIARVRAAAVAAGIDIVSLSATYNMIHPNRAVRERGLRGLGVLAGICSNLGCGILSLCTGTRDPDNMWRRHPDNDTPAAWDDLLTEIRRAIEIAERHDLLLGIEPEPGNVVSSAQCARVLLDDTSSNRIGIVLDPANLIEGIAPDRVDAMIDEGITLLGEHTIIAHGKDRDAAGVVQPPGHGIVPWPRFLSGLQAAGYDGHLILHGLTESDAPASTAYLRNILTKRLPA
jgi:sugar phosphate isomerase/epimerase